MSSGLQATAGWRTCLGELRVGQLEALREAYALKSPQCRYRKMRLLPTIGDLNVVSPASTVCLPSKRKTLEPGQ